MRLTTVILLASLLQVSAATFGQRITLTQRNAPLMSVLKEIRSQSGFNIFFENETISNGQKVSIDVRNVTVSQALEAAFKGLNLTFEIDGESIAIKKTEKSIFKTTSGRFKVVDVRGKVMDSLGNGLAGVTVTVKNGKGATSTAANGEFYLRNVEQNSVLLISYLGYVTKEVTVDKEYLDIWLQQSESKLDEIQIIAYGTTSRRLNTANVTSIKAEDIAKQPINNPLLALAGRVPGLAISQSSGLPGSGIRISVQGTNSINTNGNNILYVIDGTPYPSQLLPNLGAVLGAPNSDSNSGNPLSFINPLDIESIDVLKDAAATSIYGSRAANGAILITTKKGKVGDMKVEVNLQSGMGHVSRKLDLLNTQQYLAMRREAYSNDGIDFVSTFPFGAPEYASFYAPDLLLFEQNRYTDWQEELIGNTAHYNDAQLTLSGGSTNLQYLIGGNYHRESTVFPGKDRDQKFSTKFNLTGKSVNQKFRFSLNGSAMFDDNGLSNEDLTNAAMILPPNAPSLYNADGSLNWELTTLSNTSITFPAFGNPLGPYQRKYRNQVNNLLINSNAAYEIIQGLELSTNIGLNRLYTDELLTNPSTVAAPLYQPTYGRTVTYGMNQINSWIVEPQLSYHLNSEAGKFHFQFGSSIQQSNNKVRRLYGEGYRNDYVLEDITAAQSLTSSYGLISKYKYAGYFGRVNYSYSDKYIAEVTARRDGSSRFGANNKYHSFAAISAAWLVSNENFFKLALPFISFGKLRASYGTTGNDQIGDYKYLTLYNNNAPPNPYLGSNGLTPANLPNPELQWEETRKLSTGLDLGLLKDRILLNTTYSINRSGNQLLYYSLPPSVGFTIISSNFPAVVQNTTWEFSIMSSNIKSPNFQWDTYFNVTVPDNKLVEFPNLEKSSYAKDLTVGKPISLSPRLYKFAGINTETGIAEYFDLAGNRTSTPDIDPDNRYLRFNTAQQLYGGLSNTFKYRDFQLDFLLQFVRQKGPNYSRGDRAGFNAVNQPAYVLNHWQKTGDIKHYSKFTTSDFDIYAANTLLAESDAVWGDASYIRLKNASISWQLPKKVQNILGFKNARLYAQGQNLITITNYKGLDPESLSSLTLPPLRVMTLGIQLNL